MTVGDALMALLEYRDVLGVVATTTDGLVVAAAGVDDDDAELVAAAGAAVARGLGGSEQGQGNVAVPGGAVHVVTGPDLMLVGLTEAGVNGGELRPLMQGVLAEVGEALHDGRRPA